MGAFKVLRGRAAPASQTPTLQNVTVPMGAYTNKNSGGVYLKNLGLTADGSPAVTSWRISNITAVGGGANGDLTNTLAAGSPTAANATARTPLPSVGSNTALTLTLAATSYTMTVTAVGADATEATCTLTFAVQASAFNIGDDYGSGGRDTAAAMNPWKTQVGGLTALIAVGADYGSTQLLLQNVAPSSGRMTVQYADPARPSRMASVRLSSCTAVDVASLGYGGAQMNHIHADGCTDCTVSDAYPLGASVADIYTPDPHSQRGLYVSACTDCNFPDNHLEWVGQGLAISAGSVRCYAPRTRMRYVYGDFMTFGTGVDMGCPDSIFCSPMRFLNVDDHIDFIQIGDATFPDGVDIRRVRCYQADGDSGSIPFINGGDGTGGLSPTKRVLMKGAVFCHRAGTAFNGGLHAGGSEYSDATIFQVPSGTVAINDVTAGPSDNLSNVTPAITMQPSTGTNLMERLFSSGSAMGTIAGWTKTSGGGTFANKVYDNTQFTYAVGNYNREPAWTKPSVDWSAYLNYADAYERLGNYHSVNNPVGMDYPNMSIDEIDVASRTILAPKVSGTLDHAASGVDGGLNFDASVKA